MTLGEAGERAGDVERRQHPHRPPRPALDHDEVRGGTIDHDLRGVRELVGARDGHDRRGGDRPRGPFVDVAGLGCAQQAVTSLITPLLSVTRTVIDEGRLP